MPWRRLAPALVVLGLTPSPAEAYKVYVSNEKGNSITVIDSETQAVTATVPVGRRPRGITISKDGKLLYLCASDEDGVEVIDTTTMKVVRTLQSGAEPELFILHPSG